MGTAQAEAVLGLVELEDAGAGRAGCIGVGFYAFCEATVLALTFVVGTNIT